MIFYLGCVLGVKLGFNYAWNIRVRLFSYLSVSCVKSRSTPEYFGGFIKVPPFVAVVGPQSSGFGVVSWGSELLVVCLWRYLSS